MFEGSGSKSRAIQAVVVGTRSLRYRAYGHSEKGELEVLLFDSDRKVQAFLFQNSYTPNIELMYTLPGAQSLDAAGLLKLLLFWKTSDLSRGLLRLAACPCTDVDGVRFPQLAGPCPSTSRPIRVE